MNFTNQNSKKPVRQAFAHCIRFTASSTAARVDVNPVEAGASTFFGTSVTNLGNLYEQFRLVDLRVTMFPLAELPSATGNTHTMVTIGYNPMTSASGLSTHDDIIQLADSSMTASGCMVPVTFRLSRKELFRGKNVKWYHVDDSPDPDTAVQGQIVYVATGSNSTTAVVCWVIRSVWEFRAPVPFGEFVEKVKSNPSAFQADSKVERAHLVPKQAPLKGPSSGAQGSRAVMSWADICEEDEKLMGCAEDCSSLTSDALQLDPPPASNSETVVVELDEAEPTDRIQVRRAVPPPAPPALPSNTRKSRPPKA